MSTPILIITLDPAGQVTRVNRNCEAVTGYLPSELIGLPIWARLPQASAEAATQLAFERLIGGAGSTEFELDWQTKPGVAITVLCQCLPIYRSDGGLDALVASVFDVGRMRSIWTELGEALDRHQGILDTAVDAIITIDQRGRIDSFNRAAERIFGYRASEVLGRNVSTLMPSPYRERHDEFLRNYLSTRRKKIIGIGREVEGLRKDGTVFPMELAVGEVMLSSGRTFTGIVRDISDRKATEQESRRRLDELAHIMRLRSMGELAAGLAHEINQPLTAIVSSAQACHRLLASGDVDVELMMDSLRQIARQGERAAEVIRRLRRHVEKGELEKQPHDLATSVHEVLALFAHELSTRKVNVDVQVPSQLPPVLVDRVQIEQVIVNLIRNALDAMLDTAPDQRGLRITLSADFDGTRAGLLLAVEDRGSGIDPDIAERLFEPFQTTKPDGLGQGLAICRRIVEAHDGRIWAGPGQAGGALFQVWLPVEDEAR